MSEVRILTLNCWGLKYVSSKRRARISAIAEKLGASDDYDIVALQEVWVDEDFLEISRAVSKHLPFVKRWHSGMLAGPGLAVFSRWVIDSAWLYRFPLNGRPSAFWRGDWYVGKSAGVCVIQHPFGRKIEIINAHLHAPYALTGDAAYECHRASQAWDLAGIVSRGLLSGYATFVTGDLNMRPNTVGLKLMSICGKLSDAWEDSHEHIYSAKEISELDEKDQIDLAGVTSDSRLNTWRANYDISRAKRLDYIFYDKASARALESKVCFNEVINGVGSMSDHFAFSAKFELFSTRTDISTPSSPMSPAQQMRGSPVFQQGATFSDLIPSTRSPFVHNAFSANKSNLTNLTNPANPMNASANMPNSPKRQTRNKNQQNTDPKKMLRLSTGQFTGHNAAIAKTKHIDVRDELLSLYDELLAIIEDYKPTLRSQSFWRIMHFNLSMLVIIGMLVAVWWGAAHNRPYVGFIFMIVSILVGITGTLDGLIGFLFGRNEHRALLEFEDQTQLALRNLTMYTN